MALKIVDRHASSLGLSVDYILRAADGLLDGSMSAADFRAEMFDDTLVEIPLEPFPEPEGKVEIPPEPEQVQAPWNDLPYICSGAQ